MDLIIYRNMDLLRPIRAVIYFTLFHNEFQIKLRNFDNKPDYRRSKRNNFSHFNLGKRIYLFPILPFSYETFITLNENRQRFPT